MKVSPRANYPVRVRPFTWDVPPEVASLYVGAYEVTLNSVVDVVFVPEVEDAGPPFPHDLVPESVDLITTIAQARLGVLEFAHYAVTPNDDLAGRVERLELQTHTARAGALVFYVSRTDFAGFAAELDELHTRLGALHPEGSVADVADQRVIQFLRETVLTSPGFDPDDLAMLQDPVQP